MVKKRVLITGKNSYIGSKFLQWVKQNHIAFEVETVSVRDESWKNIKFSHYDTVLHLAGIAHVSTDPKLEDIYYKVNRDLSLEIAKYSKEAGVKQFILMSSIIVYGDSTPAKKQIDRNTTPIPSNFYGKSKLQAEEGISLLESDSFKVAIIRPPMVYGKDCKGNFPRLSKIAQKFPIFPDYDNIRSIIHIDNLCEFIKLLIENEDRGLFFPQNKELVKTSQLVKLLAEIHGKNIKFTRIFNPFIKFLVRYIPLFNKVFGNLAYTKEISRYKENYQVRDLEESIKLTEFL